MTKKNEEERAHALNMEELENVNGGASFEWYRRKPE
jgi:hypothetical protein